MSRNKMKFTTAVVSGALLLGGMSACNRDQSTATLLAEAKQYQQKGDQKAALIQLKNAVAKSPEDAEARLQLGALYLETGDAVSTDKEVRKAASLGMAPARTLPLLAQAMMMQGQFKQLLAEVKPEQAAKSAQLQALRGDALLATGDTDGAKAAYQAALAIDPASGAAMIGLARHGLVTKDKEATERYAAEAIAKDSKNPDVWMFQGGMLRGMDKQDEALAAFDKVLALRPRDHNANLEKAYIRINQNKFAEARAEIDAARKLAPNGLLVTYAQALLDYSEGKNKEARESLQKILKSAPNHMPSVLLAGAVEVNLDAPQQAQMHLRKYLEADPNNVYARKLLAQALLKGSKPGEAAAALAPGLDQSQDPQLLALAGESYLQARNFDQATAYLEKAAKLAPNVAVLRTSLGMSRLQQGDVAKGIGELERATELDPKSVPALVALAEAELRLKHYDKALAAVAKLEQLRPQDAPTLTLKASVYAARGDLAATRSALEKASQADPTYFEAASNLARIDLIEKKPDAARKRFEDILAKDKKNLKAMAALADLAMLGKRPEEATTWLEKAQAENPESIPAVIKLGNHYLGTKHEQKALTLARNMYTSHPLDTGVLDLLGRAQIANKDYQGALDSYSKLVKMAPKSAEAELRLAAVYAQMKNDTAATGSLKRAADLQPAQVQVRGAQIQLALRQGKVDEALAIARDLQKQNQNSAAGHVFEGDILVSQKKYEPALAVYRKGLEVAPVPQIVIKMAETMNLLGRNKEVEPLLANWIKQHPDDALAAMYAADNYLANKQSKQAIALFESALKTNPGNARMLNNLAYAYQMEKDPRAVPTAEQALKAAPDSPAVMDTLGWMLVEQGNTQRGLPLLQKAASVAGPATTPEMRYHLAVGLNKSGDKQGARKELETLLAQNKSFSQLEEARSLLKTL